MRSGFLPDLRESRDPVRRVSGPRKRASRAPTRKAVPPKGIEPRLGVPPIDFSFPAFATRSGRMRSNGKSGRSCSLSLTYVTFCRDSARCPNAVYRNHERLERVCHLSSRMTCARRLCREGLRIRGIIQAYGRSLHHATTWSAPDWTASSQATEHIQEHGGCGGAYTGLSGLA